MKNTKLWFSNNFKELILPHEPKKLPKVPTYTKNMLERARNDFEIMKEWNVDPYSIPEFFSLITSLIKKQPKGESGTLLNNGYANILYVKLANGTVVAVYVFWYGVDRVWGFHACAVDDVRWDVGYYVFSRSLTFPSNSVSSSDTLSLESRVKELENKMSKLEKVITF